MRSEPSMPDLSQWAQACDTSESLETGQNGDAARSLSINWLVRSLS